MINLINDVATVSNIKPIVVQGLMNNMGYTLIDNLIEQSYDDETVVEFNIGIGTLSLKIDDDEVKYIFKPSKQLESGIVAAINENENILEENIYESIDRHIYKTYKDML